MHIQLSEEHKLLQEEVRRFADEVVAPRAKEIDQSGEFPRAFFEQAGQLGLAGVAIPEEHGGAGMDTLAYCLVIEEISRSCATSGVILSVNNQEVTGADQMVAIIDKAAKDGRKAALFQVENDNRSRFVALPIDQG